MEELDAELAVVRSLAAKGKYDEAERMLHVLAARHPSSMQIEDLKFRVQKRTPVVDASWSEVEASERQYQAGYVVGIASGVVSILAGLVIAAAYIQHYVRTNIDGVFTYYMPGRYGHFYRTGPWYQAMFWPVMCIGFGLFLIWLFRWKYRDD
jgi:hypothetical protein